MKSITETKQGKHNPLKINNLYSSFKQDLVGHNSVSTKYLENYVNLTIFKQETSESTVNTRTSLLADKLKNVSKVARWKDLRGKGYPPFVYNALDIRGSDFNLIYQTDPI